MFNRKTKKIILSLESSLVSCCISLDSLSENTNVIYHLSTMDDSSYRLKPGAHTAILVGRFRFRWMFSAKTISDRICGLIYIATFANIIHLNLNRPTKIAVCAPGLNFDLGKKNEIHHHS
jgi:hypothetical protein